MSERASDRWVSAVLSVLLHGGVIGLLGFGWWSFHRPSRPVPTLAIDATVVDAKTLEGARSAPTPVMPRPPPPPPPEPPPKDDQAERAAAEQREAEQKHEAEEKQRAQEQAEAERKAQEQAQLKAQEEAQRKAQEEAQRKAKEEAERQAQEQKKAKEAEAKRQAEERRKAEEAKQTAQSEADLQRDLAEEERITAARASGAMVSWQQQIQAKIHHAWYQPPKVRPDLDCTLYLTQVPGGQVVDVKVGACNADEAVRASIQDAAYRASPLPPPPDPALFDRKLAVHFTMTQ
jgi:colicin import membrane protein